MRILKYVFLLLLLSVVALTVFIATQEGKYDIKKERVIRVPKMVLYNYINEYRNWENVGILTGSDTTAVFSFSENSSGVGSEMSWKKDGSTGSVKTTRLAENDSIVQKAIIDNLNSEIYWKFKDTLKSTKVTIRVKGELSFREKANALFNGENINSELKASLTKGLNNLNDYLVHELTLFNIKVKEDGLVIKSGTFYLGQPVTSKIEDINKKASEIFPKLLSFMKGNKIIKKGPPFILYRTIDKVNDKASYVVCMPIKDEMFTSPGSEYEGGKLQSFSALKTTLKGDYSHLRKAWDKAQSYITEKGLQENTSGQYIELYTKGVKNTKRPSEWITDIYIPIGQPTVVPVIDDTTAATTQPLAKPAVTPTTTGTRPATTPATGTKPATNTTGTKPAGTTVPPKSAATKPATGTSTKPSGTTSGTTKPATAATGTTPKPATPKPASSKPSAATTAPVSKPATQPTETP